MQVPVKRRPRLVKFNMRLTDVCSLRRTCIVCAVIFYLCVCISAINCFRWMAGLVWFGLVGLLFFSGMSVYIAQFRAKFLSWHSIQTVERTVFHNNRHNLHVTIRPHRIFDKNRIVSKIWRGLCAYFV